MVVLCVRVPDVPVTVTVNVPVFARLPTVSVNVLVEVAGFGLNDADTRFGNPVAVKLTLPSKPFDGVIVMVVEPFAPRAMLKLEVDAARLKSGPGGTVKEIVTALFRFPEAPLIVTVKVPTAAVALAVRVRVLEPAVLAGLKDALTPLGRPAANKVTVPLNPLSGLTMTVLVPLLPWTTVKLFGDAPKVKLPAGLTVRVIVVLFVETPDTPLIVMLAVPIVAVADAVSVNVLLLVAPLGLKEAVTPFGKPEADKLTVPLNPFCGMMVIVPDPLVPCVTVKLVGAAESVKVCVEIGQLLTRFAALTVPIPVAKSQPVLVPKAG